MTTRKSSSRNFVIFYLYALAGKILAPTIPKFRWKRIRLERVEIAVSSFAGKESFWPPRRFLPECKAVLNYICAVRNNDRLLRVTATNKEGVMIHSFDYVTFDEKISWGELIEKESFLGGKLKKAEFNQDMSKPGLCG
jgi:hypothetical protein